MGFDGEARPPLLRWVIGSVLRRIRLRQGRTLREVAGDADVSVPYLSELERGRKEPSSEVLASICRALGIGLVDLLDEVRDELCRVQPAVPVRLPVRRGVRFQVGSPVAPVAPLSPVGPGRVLSVGPGRVSPAGPGARRPEPPHAYCQAVRRRAVRRRPVVCC